MTADPAALEVSLVFGMDEGASEAFDDWRAFVDCLYTQPLTLRPPLPESDPTKRAWLLRALRELRHILLCCECEAELEVKLVLSAYLLRFARLSRETDLADVKRRHAYALVVGEQIIDSLA